MALAPLTLVDLTPDTPVAVVDLRTDGPTPGTPAAQTATCHDRACSAPGVVVCAYVDSRRRPCGTRWCSRHSRLVAGSRYCRRHASTVQALGPKSADPRTLPSVGHRGASLVDWVFTEGHPIFNRALLSGLGPGQVIFEDHSVMVSRTADGRRRWERGWRIGDRDGIRHKIVLRVEERDDTRVLVVAQDRVVAMGVPPWISHRGEETPASNGSVSQRRLFYSFLGSFVREALADSP